MKDSGSCALTNISRNASSNPNCQCACSGPYLATPLLTSCMPCVPNCIVLTRTSPMLQSGVLVAVRENKNLPHNKLDSKIEARLQDGCLFSVFGVFCLCLSLHGK